MPRELPCDEVAPPVTDLNLQHWEEEKQTCLHDYFTGQMNYVHVTLLR